MRNVRREKISTRQELNIFFGRIHFTFLPLPQKPQKCIFSQLIPQNGTLQSHILRGYLKNSANKICDVM